MDELGEEREEAKRITVVSAQDFRELAVAAGVAAFEEICREDRLRVPDGVRRDLVIRLCLAVKCMSEREIAAFVELPAEQLEGELAKFMRAHLRKAIGRRRPS